LAVVERSEDAIPVRKMLNFVKEKKPGMSPRKLLKHRKQSVNIRWPEATETIILKVYEEDVFTGGRLRFQKALYQLVEIIGFTRPAGTRYGEDGALFAEVERELFSGCQRGEHRFTEPFGNNLEELISVHKLFTYVNKNNLNCLLCQTNFEKHRKMLGGVV
jgi:hypothetical protein